MPLIADEHDHDAYILRKPAGDEARSVKLDDTQPVSSSRVSGPMTYKQLGRSGLKVSQVILGCMGFGSPEWQKWVLPEER